MSEILNKKTEVSALIKPALNRKHKCIFFDCEETEVHAVDMMWDGGSRYSYALYDIRAGSWLDWRDFRTEKKALASSPFSGGALSVDVRIPEGCVLIKSGTFCGKTATEVLYGRAKDVKA